MTTNRPQTTPTIVCPTCGTRASAGAARCLVCGTALGGGGKAPAKAQRTVRGTRMPEITLSLPLALLLFVLFLSVGGAAAYYGLNLTGSIASPTQTATITVTPTQSLTPTLAVPTETFTPQPTPTPVSYIVKANDTCGAIAFAFDVSVQSIILQNNLSADCTLSVGQELKIPAPTPTPTPLATSTLSNFEATRAACNTETYVVQQDETLGIIALTYGISAQSIIDWNGLTTDNVFAGQRLEIPLCQIEVIFGVGTVTPSPAPPYPAPQLLLPVDGEAFDLSSDAVTLQWSSVGALRPNEQYQVTIIDLTKGEDNILIVQVLDTKFILPLSLRPTESRPHIFRWFVVTVAQVGVDEEGNPVWVEGGVVSQARVFSWSGAAVVATPTP